MNTAISGGRRLSTAALAGRTLTLDDGRPVSRKDLSEVARIAQSALALRPSLRLVLHELVGVYGEHFIQDRLIVWPSNEYLIDRTGLSERAIRYAIHALTELELITPRDSANGKRFAVRNDAGVFVNAYGFDLTPLYARRGELELLAERRTRERAEQNRLFDEITICRRAAQEALSALQTRFPEAQSGDLEAELDALIGRTPRRGFTGPISDLVESWWDLRIRAEQRFYESGNAGKSSRHKESNNESPTETCNKAQQPVERGGEVADLSIPLILEACPALSEYAQPIQTERDMINAGWGIRATIGAHPSAWNEALEEIGPLPAAAAAAFVLQLHVDDATSGRNQIRNPGGYFRALIRAIKDGKFRLVAELHGLRRRKMM